jgi:hypothetical protein
MVKLMRKGIINIASLSAIQIQKLREYEKEMNVILVAYQKEKSDKHVMRTTNGNMGKNTL